MSEDADHPVGVGAAALEIDVSIPIAVSGKWPYQAIVTLIIDMFIKPFGRGAVFCSAAAWVAVLKLSYIVSIAQMGPEYWVPAFWNRAGRVQFTPPKYPDAIVPKDEVVHCVF